ncbi:acetyl-CoA carboxylase biotin carboxyl carrier protein [Umezawaea endophytica]|uniref:Biotin carboxyl carrier protein of acetyl-CoA carboxylase n=1 Tax=Umezawaea endophytica TaxID=1654476 RepID=A0A9X2VW98_9PSEU|nr:biotin/lipoyl-containing protein [Umezawaea endophytica]MCS7484105.1 acetyl-CoA carboxylase biotin carboxyl carrier protein subunit [Umezawaea endophytica]
MDDDPAVLAALSRVVGEMTRGVAHPPRRIDITFGAARIEVDWGERPSDDRPAVRPAAVEEDQAPNTHQVCAPVVGTFYAAPEPGAAPFVAVGDVVEAGQQVAIVEAMKLMNAVEATMSGRVVRVLASDCQPVEYGQPLLLLEPV